MILVTGATGMIGRSLVAQLDERGVAFRAASRSRDQENAIPNLVTVDFAEPASIAGALHDADAVFLNTAQHPDMAAIQGNIVDAAKQAGVRHIVKLSAGTAFLGPDSLAGSAARTPRSRPGSSIPASGGRSCGLATSCRTYLGWPVRSATGRCPCRCPTSTSRQWTPGT